MSESVLDQVRQIAADVFDLSVEHIAPADGPGTIDKWDSIQHLNLVLAVEQAFGLTFEPEEVDAMTGVQAVAELVEGKLAGQG